MLIRKTIWNIANTKYLFFKIVLKYSGNFGFLPSKYLIIMKLLLYISWFLISKKRVNYSFVSDFWNMREICNIFHK